MLNRIILGVSTAILMAAAGAASGTAILGAASDPLAHNAPAGTVGGLYGENQSSGGGTPSDAEIFVRGAFNGWGTDDAMSFDGTAYSATLELGVATWEFRVGSEDWAVVNLGAGSTGSNDVLLNSARLLGPGTLGNLFLNITTAGLYTFTLDASPGMESPTLLVSAVTSIAEPATLALIGLPLVWLAITRRRRTRGF